MNKLQAINKGSQIIDQIFWELLKILKTKHSLTELDLANQIKKLGKKFGGEAMAFPPIVSFGSSSAQIHHKPSKKRIGKNNFLMLDYGVKVKGYCSDFTRTLFIGNPNKFQEKVYNTVLKSQLAALKEVKLGVDCYKIDLIARKIVIDAGFGRHFNHSTGHAVGIKIHEPPSFSPVSSEQLLKSTVMTVEPGIYLPGKFGVRIEDMILVSNKSKIFSKVPKDFKSMIIR